MSVLSAGPAGASGRGVGDANPRAAAAAIHHMGASLSTQQWRALVPPDAKGEGRGLGRDEEDPLGPDAVAKFAEWHAMRKYATS